MATWKKVLTEADIIQSVTDGNTTAVPSSDAVYDAIAAVSAAAGSGDITKIESYPNGGIVVWNDENDDGTFTQGAANFGDAQIQVKPGDGISVGTSGVSIASSAAGTGLAFASGVLSVAGGQGINVSLTDDEVQVRADSNHFDFDSNEALRLKVGGVTFDRLADGAVYRVADGGSFPVSDDSQLASTRSIAQQFPNVTLGTGSESYISLNGQEITANTIDISANTNLAVADTTGQTGVDLTLSNSAITATLTGLTTTSAVQFSSLALSTTLDVDGNGTVDGNLTVGGNLTVQGDSFITETETVRVEDHNITLGYSSTANTDTANGGGVCVATGNTETEFPEVYWRKTGALTGWSVQDYESGRSDQSNTFPISIMEVKANAQPGSTDDSAGVGSFWFDETSDELYIRTL